MQIILIGEKEKSDLGKEFLALSELDFPKF